MNIETSTSGGGSDISEFIEYLFSSDTITVDSNSTSEFTVQLSVLENAVDGLASTFLVVAQSVLGDSSDYVPFQLTLSTRPLPEFTENVSGICTWHNDVAIPLVCYDVKVYCKCMACYSALRLFLIASSELFILYHTSFF